MLNGQGESKFRKSGGASVQRSFCFVVLLSFAAQPAVLATVDAVVTKPTAQEIKQAQDLVRISPKDAQARFNLAELLRRSGLSKEAAAEYAEAASLQPSMYVAYHQLCQCNPDPALVDQALERLTKLKDEKPKDLLLRVALSELMEQKKDFYHAARTLVDLLYQNEVPERFVPKVNARIRLLLGKARDAQTMEKAHGDDEELEVVPPPLPESSLRRDLQASKIREPKVMPGIGHAPLLP
ncbi:MAG TPA: hypothetical protein V6D17_23915 [Candidatus Obscuribacterales bacterium]